MSAEVYMRYTLRSGRVARGLSRTTLLADPAIRWYQSGPGVGLNRMEARREAGPGPLAQTLAIAAEVFMNNVGSIQ
jgi:hypothetical protein